MAEHSSSNRNLRARWAAVGAAVAVTLGAAGIGSYNLVNADVSSGDRPVFIPINPCRLLDTRPAPENVGPRNTPIDADETISVTAHGENGECTGPSEIPTDATALAMNVTALNATSQTFLTFWGEGANPGTANLNPSPGQPPTPNAVNTPLSGTGTFNLYNERGMVDVVIDVNGYYAPHDHDDRYYTEAEADDRFLPIPDQVFIGPAAFESRTNDPTSEDYILVASSEITVGGLACFSAQADLPDGATIDSVSAIVSTDTTANGFQVNFGRTLIADGTPLLSAGIGSIASDLMASATTADTLTHITLPITGDAIDNGDDSVVDNSTFAYYAQVCLYAGQTLFGFIVDLA